MRPVGLGSATSNKMVEAKAKATIINDTNASASPRPVKPSNAGVFVEEEEREDRGKAEDCQDCHSLCKSSLSLSASIIASSITASGRVREPAA